MIFNPDIKRYTLLSFFTVIILGTVKAQFSIRGLVKNEAGIVLPQAGLSLHFILSGVKRQLATDSLGEYFINALPEGKYLLTASYSGYQMQNSDTILLNSQRPVSHLLFSLKPGGYLETVTVKSLPPPVQTEAGKLVFNLQNQAVTAGQTAFDVLRKLPGVSMDQNENLLLRGGAGVNVMVDGKMTYLAGTQLTTYLKGLAAEDLSRVELITTPGAAFDAAGNSGVIQIVTKRKLAPGYAIEFRSAATWSKWWLWNENVTASYRTKKWKLYGSFDFNTPHRYYDKQSGNSLPGTADSLKLERTQQTAFKIKYYTYRFGWDWQLHPAHQLSLRYHGYFDDWTGTHWATVNTINKASGKRTGFIKSINALVEPYHYDSPGLSYRFDLDAMGRKLTFDADYTSYKNYSDGLLTTRSYSSHDAFISENKLKVHQPGFIEIKSMKADLDLPYKTFSINAGLKWARVNNDNRYQFDSLSNGQYEPAGSMSNRFEYQETIAAAYLAFSKSWSDTRINAGLRVEDTDANGHTQKGTDGNRWSYTKLFPSASLTQQLDENSEIALSVSRRINRPGYSELNPVRWYSDPYFYFSGNSLLVPELAWVYSATYSFRKKYLFSAGYNRSTNFINRLLVFEGQAVRSMTANLGDQHRVDFTASLPLRLLSFWTVQLFSDLSFSSYPISMKSGLKNISQWANTTTAQQSFSLKKGWQANLNAAFYSSELKGIYQTRPTGFVDIGLKRTFWDNRLTVQLNCNDIFNTNRVKAHSKTDVVDYFYNDKQYTRQVSLSMTYHIGGTIFSKVAGKTEEQQRL